MKKLLRSASILLVVCLMVAGLLLVSTHRQAIVDRYMYMTYQPTSAMQKIADQSGMSDKGEFYLFASHPEIEDKQGFNQNCGSHEKSTAVLGCYVDDRVYLYQVTNNELNGIMQVTAAHEMLHAAYERLSAKDRSQVDNMLQAEASRHERDKDFAERMSVYESLPQSEYVNELHSVVGTELTNLSPQLEHYYSRYFSDRHKVTSLYEQYSGVFHDLRDKAEALVASLNSAAKEINNRTTQYNLAVKSLSADIAQFNQRARSGDFSSQAEFNSARAGLTSRAQSLDNERQAINQLIAKYNRDKQQLDKTNLHLSNLDASINSSLQPAPQVE